MNISNPIDVSDNETKQMIKDFAQRVQALDEEMERLKDSKKEVFEEAKINGIDTKILRKAIKDIRDALKADEQEKDMVDIYTEVISDVVRLP